MDYRGYRVVCQTIIPGLLQREHDSAVVYGSIDTGQNITSEEHFVELVSSFMSTSITNSLLCTAEEGC